MKKEIDEENLTKKMTKNENEKENEFFEKCFKSIIMIQRDVFENHLRQCCTGFAHVKSVLSYNVCEKNIEKN